MSVPQRFGKYAVVDRLGVGGMAEVWRCRLSGVGGFEKQVVVKRILPHLLADPDFVQMFMDEARVAANLSHANIVHVYEIDVADGVPYIAMEFVGGPTFSTVLKRARDRGVLNIAHSVRILREVCDALHYAHNAKDASGNALGLVHRDVSPHNILISPEGVPKLLDFGVAKSRGKLADSRPGTLKGKLSYMAPEQMQPGWPVDHRADLFSIGVCLYEATTGRRPFRADSDAGLIVEVLSGGYRKASELVPGFPPELDLIIDWALQPDPDDRCGDAATLRDALAGFEQCLMEPSSAISVAAWVAQMFPPTDPWIPSTSNVYGAGNRPATVGKGIETRAESLRGRTSLPLPPPLPVPLRMDSGDIPSIDEADPITDPAAPQPKRRRHGVWRQWRPAILISAFVLLGLAVGVLLFVELVANNPPTPLPEPERTTGAVDNDAAARAYLEEAEKLMKSGQQGVAIDLLTKARDMQPRDPALGIRITKLLNTVDLDVAIQGARQFLQMGDAEKAIELANAALAKDPLNSEAARILVEARKLRSASKPNEDSRVVPERGRPIRRDRPIAVTEPPHATSEARAPNVVAPVVTAREEPKPVPPAPPHPSPSPSVEPVPPRPVASLATVPAPQPAAPSAPAAAMPAPVAPTKTVQRRVVFAEGMTPPVFISGPDIQYTDEALDREIEGTMSVKCIVTVEGVVKGCRVLKSVPFMDRAVVEALQHRKYAPVTFEGKPVEAEYIFAIRLKMPR
jgi:TonB family protein